jgi:CO dehydrogenase/acetyl-CoA synthase epsilon subunit
MLTSNNTLAVKMLMVVGTQFMQDEQTEFLLKIAMRDININITLQSYYWSINISIVTWWS